MSGHRKRGGGTVAKTPRSVQFERDFAKAAAGSIEGTAAGAEAMRALAPDLRMLTRAELIDVLLRLGTRFASVIVAIREDNPHLTAGELAAAFDDPDGAGADLAARIESDRA